MPAAAPSPFDYRDYRFFWAARLASTIASTMLVVVIGIHVYDIARLTMSIGEASFWLGMVGLAQFLPLFLLTLVAGYVADRIDRLPSGKLAILDFKTGKPPAKKQVEAGFALQLGLLGMIAEDGGFENVAEAPTQLEYWSLAKHDRKDQRGFVEEIGPAEHILAEARHHFSEAAARWLTGNDPFTAKLQPRFACYGDYDQLMRLEEWLGRS